ncbi:MAG: HD domain-containing protein [Patescibacteria group bacterium]
MKSQKIKKNKKEHKIVNFLYEVGTMRKLMRMHRQALLTDDMSDNIASHSYRVAVISWFLAKEEGADPYKTVMMSLFHDTAEIRSNDHNWIHKKYIKVFEHEIHEDQLGTLPYPELRDFVDEYQKRQSREAILAKEADLLDQILLLREYEWSGNKEASMWLYGKNGSKVNAQLEKLKTETGKRLGKSIYEVDPSDWWKNLWTSHNRI